MSNDNEKDLEKTPEDNVNDADVEEQGAVTEPGEFDDFDATWSEVFDSCCHCTPKDLGTAFLGISAVATCLYFFIIGLELLSNSSKVMTSCKAGALFGENTNPIAGLMVGILSTVLLQSSSSTTSIVVSMVGAGSIAVDAAIYMIMGANIGTSVTSTLVAMGHLGDGDELERAFAGATVHDMFNFLTVAVLLPVEVITGYLYRVTKAMVKNANPEEGEAWESPLDKIIQPVVKRILDDNSDVVKHVSKGGSCADFYPIVCEDGVVSAKTCEVALIKCYKDANVCPIFFYQYADQEDEVMAGMVSFILAIVLMFCCLAGLVIVLKKLLLGVSTRIIYKATDMNPYFSMVVGALITMFVQSSSITTSVLTPLVGAGVLQWEKMLPLTLGANVGTTVTALLAALVSASADSLQVALAHLMFNITGIVIWYPLPFMRRVPLGAAAALGKATRVWRGFPIVYIIVCFFLLPIMLYGLSMLFEGSKGLVALGTVLVIFIGLWLLRTIYWFKYKNGREELVTKFAARQRKNDAINNLPDDMDKVKSDVADLKRQIRVLVEHTGAPEEEIFQSVDDDDAEKEKLLDNETSGDSNASDPDVVKQSITEVQT